MHHFSPWLYSRLQHYKLHFFAPTSCRLNVVLHIVARVVEYPTQAQTQGTFDQGKKSLVVSEVFVVARFTDARSFRIELCTCFWRDGTYAGFHFTIWVAWGKCGAPRFWRWQYIFCADNVVVILFPDYDSCYICRIRNTSHVLQIWWKVCAVRIGAHSFFGIHCCLLCVQSLLTEP